MMLEVAVSKAVFDMSRRKCLECRLFVEKDQSCPQCWRWYEELEPWWLVRLGFEEVGGDCARRSNVLLTSPVLDTVMVLSLSDFVELSRHYERDLSEYVTKFFVGNHFMIRHSVDRVLAMSVMPGWKLNFRMWLGLQPGFDFAEITSVIAPCDIDDTGEVAERLTRADMENLLQT